MNEVNEQEYNNYVNTLVSPTIETLEECGILRTRHLVLDILHAEKAEHNLINQVIYKIKQL